MDVFVINETWLNPNDDLNDFSENFNIYRKDRITHGGGVLVAVHNNYNSYEIKDFNELQSEIIGVGIIYNKIKILITTIYIPPQTSKPFEHLKTLIKVILKLNYDHVFVYGDWNIDFLEQSKYVNDIINFMQTHGFCICINEPTYPANDSKKLYDVFTYKKHPLFLIFQNLVITLLYILFSKSKRAFKSKINREIF
ncbi:uncharacterized protein B4U79_18807 [Dinothrombium tinctorium]|uniref:Endonuclease/exonuclease/phosphatase domain-containing protein n=1 Tax=Dinothrombium tinctorium TaxID=1965070 RepID=A0A443Q8H5_9ACAR|nr:uncharacterized protein B4U79_18883 [Dinothrombium tinctorium]RWR99334.1 uncharacterized protein B4U79_18807 [Dinothrombium tinctorium]